MFFWGFFFRWYNQGVLFLNVTHWLQLWGLHSFVWQVSKQQMLDQISFPGPLSTMGTKHLFSDSLLLWIAAPLWRQDKTTMRTKHICQLSSSMVTCSFLHMNIEETTTIWWQEKLIHPRSLIYTYWSAGHHNILCKVINRKKYTNYCAIQKLIWLNRSTM